MKFFNELLIRIDKITEFSPNELRMISLLSPLHYFKPFLSFYLDNKKHYKRKHASELLQLFKHFAESFNQITKTEQNTNGIVK